MHYPTRLDPFFKNYMIRRTTSILRAVWKLGAHVQDKTAEGIQALFAPCASSCPRVAIRSDMQRADSSRRCVVVGEPRVLRARLSSVDGRCARCPELDSSQAGVLLLDLVAE
jgi:hypothetical protein